MSAFPILSIPVKALFSFQQNYLDVSALLRYNNNKKSAGGDGSWKSSRTVLLELADCASRHQQWPNCFNHIGSAVCQSLSEETARQVGSEH